MEELKEELHGDFLQSHHQEAQPLLQRREPEIKREVNPSAEYLKGGGGVPTGHAVVMLQSDGQNSIIIVGGANMEGWGKVLEEGELEVVRNAGIVLLQREIPDYVNIQVAKRVKEVRSNSQAKDLALFEYLSIVK
ncbi:hypothetical protein Sjap_000711 [Stephania japonica]|uniref:Uncharacterized protein n=1 Tax=Stephania japonica TaxID=461633 RepID=A0AAP0KIM9_9MAGN